jgi:hypothetical protein
VVVQVVGQPPAGQGCTNVTTGSNGDSGGGSGSTGDPTPTTQAR